MKIFFLLTFCCVLIACSSTALRPPGLSEQLKVVAENALKAEIECGRNHVSETDDGTSDASTVALALALRCNKEYFEATEAWSSAYLHNEAQSRMFRKKRSGTTERIEEFLPIVMQYRQALSDKNSK